ncbi:hypothetical protein M3G18_09680 [Corynebacterium sp. p3-SID1145]|uniref:hypothetical protein n=1 Tax=unclassified Corynebacterium TaxID=2624378 RepID=UPI0021AA2BD0|nr:MULTISPECIES: hypothetical protein [unclassified Corynebacterium]MCT1453168.1 hypothetical protein [Corynebacterium sp. p3-SID1145]MCT1462279.1 hypothetical protein [Corynebacterium sp. p3-SID1140]
MGRLILLVLIIVAVWLLWRAFGPGSSERYGSLRPAKSQQQTPVIKGPDDDEEFLWNIEKNRFKERRAKEEAERKAREEEERRLRRERGNRPGNGDGSAGPDAPGTPST